MVAPEMFGTPRRPVGPQGGRGALRAPRGRLRAPRITVTRFARLVSPWPIEMAPLSEFCRRSRFASWFRSLSRALVVTWLGLAGLGWAWLGLAGLGRAWLGLVGLGWAWLGLAGFGSTNFSKTSQLQVGPLVAPRGVLAAPCGAPRVGPSQLPVGSSQLLVGSSQLLAGPSQLLVGPSHLLLGPLAAPYRVLAAPYGALRSPDAPQMVDIARIHLPPGVR